MRFSSPLPYLLVFLAAPGLLRAQDEMPGKKGKEEEITINLPEVTMKELIDIVQRETGKIFLYDQNIEKLPVSFKGGKSIPRKALYSVFKSILETRSYGISEIAIDGLVVCKIQQSRQTFTGPAKTYSSADIKANPSILPVDDTMVTVVYLLKYAEARTASNQLRQIINVQQGGNILGIPNVNVIIVTAFGSVMQRVFKIIDLLDVPGLQPEWRVYKMSHADPEAVAGKVESLLQAEHMQARNRQLQAQPPGKLIAEPRTRSLIIQAAPEQFPRILSLIRRLDVELEREPSLVHVYRLKHTNALDMEETINAIIQANPDIGMGDDAGPAVPTPKPSAGSGPSSRPRRPRIPRRSTGASSDEDRAAAIADEGTNSLIIVAPEAYYRELKKILERLDVRRPQVLIEVLIVEVSSARGLDLGAEIAVLDRAGEGSVRGFGATSFGLSNIVDQDGNPFDFTSTSEDGSVPIPMGRTPTFASQGMSFGIMKDKEHRIPILLSVLGSESDVNVLSLPRILTNANEEAEISVLEEVPTATSQSTSAVANLTGFSGFEQAGITLTITPHISENDSLRLEIDQTIEQFGKATPAVGGVVLPPQKTTRRITNEVTVPNHKTVILGGLTSSVTTEFSSKIPLLGDLPLIGFLFRNSSKKLEKTNLFVFITPHILNDPAFRDLEMLSNAALLEARSLGADTSQIDRHYREMAREEKALEMGEPGRPTEIMEYNPKRED